MKVLRGLDEQAAVILVTRQSQFDSVRTSRFKTPLKYVPTSAEMKRCTANVSALPKEGHEERPPSLPLISVTRCCCKSVEVGTLMH